MAWELSSVYPPPRASITPLTLPQERFKEAVAVFLEGLHPYWDWWIDEVGGPEAVPGLFQEPTENQVWMCIFNQDRMVGVAWFIRDFYGPAEARFQGVYVIPGARQNRVGSSLMYESINRAHQLGQRRMVIYTFSPLDHLAPGALLYLKSGGRIEAEYLELQNL